LHKIRWQLPKPAKRARQVAWLNLPRRTGVNDKGAVTLANDDAGVNRKMSNLLTGLQSAKIGTPKTRGVRK